MAKKIAPEEFVAAWQASDSLEEVAEKLKIDIDVCSSRASGYRVRGIPLKKMRAGRVKLDIEALKKIAASSNGKALAHAKNHS